MVPRTGESCETPRMGQGTEREYGKLYPVARAVLLPIFHRLWKFTIEGLENVPEDGGAIMCPNHTSVIDSFFLPCALPRRITFVGKAEYMDSWKTKYLFPALGMIPIDRGGGSASPAGARHGRAGARGRRALRHLPRGHPGPRRPAPQGPHRPGPPRPAHRCAHRARRHRRHPRGPAAGRPVPEAVPARHHPLRPAASGPSATPGATPSTSCCAR